MDKSNSRITQCNTRITLCNKVRNLCNFLVVKVVTDRIYRPPICPDPIVLFTIEITIEKVLFFLMYFGGGPPGRKVLRLFQLWCNSNKTLLFPLLSTS